MTFHERNGLRYFTFPLLDAAGLPHAVLTRRGGSSRPPFESLNLGSSVGDDPDTVGKNRRAVFDLLGRDPESVPELHQVHSNRIILAGSPITGKGLPQADGVVTDSPHVTLCLRFADCVPILLYDPVRRAAGIAHAGWKGTLAGVAASAVDALRGQFGSRPEDILAGIGPSIGPDHYAVGAEVEGAVRDTFGPAAGPWLGPRDGAVHLDLWAVNEFVLRQAGVSNIELSGICTACHTEDWFSHRAEYGRTGRFGALAWLPG
jgi:YfiH family protein